MRRSLTRSLATFLCVLFHVRHIGARPSVAKIQDLVDSARAQLSVSQIVIVSIVPHNPLVASVARAKTPNTFTMTLDKQFVDHISDEDLKSVIAHELGHVWIFTHHPYLQTEEGANEIALRIVSRDSLERLYGKVWQQAGAKGDIEYLPQAAK